VTNSPIRTPINACGTVKRITKGFRSELY